MSLPGRSFPGIYASAGRGLEDVRPICCLLPEFSPFPKPGSISLSGRQIREDCPGQHFLDVFQIGTVRHPFIEVFWDC